MRHIAWAIPIIVCLSGCSAPGPSAAQYVVGQSKAVGKCLAAVAVRDKWAKRRSAQYQDYGTPYPPVSLVVSSFKFVENRCQAAASDFAALTIPDQSSAVADKLEVAAKECHAGIASAIDASGAAAQYADKLLGNAAATQSFMAANGDLLSQPFKLIGACTFDTRKAFDGEGIQIPSSQEAMDSFDADTNNAKNDFERSVDKIP